MTIRTMNSIMTPTIILISLPIISAGSVTKQSINF